MGEKREKGLHTRGAKEWFLADFFFFFYFVDLFFLWVFLGYYFFFVLHRVGWKLCIWAVFFFFFSLKLMHALKVVSLHQVS